MWLQSHAVILGFVVVAHTAHMQPSSSFLHVTLAYDGKRRHASNPNNWIIKQNLGVSKSDGNRLSALDRTASRRKQQPHTKSVLHLAACNGLFSVLYFRPNCRTLSQLDQKSAHHEVMLRSNHSQRIFDWVFPFRNPFSCNDMQKARCGQAFQFPCSTSYSPISIWRLI